MSVWAKIAAVAGVVLLIGILLAIIKFEYDLVAKQNALEDSVVAMKNIGDGITRSQNEVVTKQDLEDLTKKLDLSKIEADLQQFHAEIDGIQVMVASTPGFHGTGIASSSTVKDPTVVPACVDGKCSDPYGILSSVQILQLDEPLDGTISIPFGVTQFKAWNKNPWDLDVFPRDYSVVTVFGQDEAGRHYVYNKFTVKVKDQSYTIPIKDSKYEEKLPDAKFHFSPRFYLSGDVGSHLDKVKPEVMPSIGVSLFSHGKTVVDPDWSFVGIGVGYASQAFRPAIVFNPVSYNVGHHLPLVNNLHLGPAISIDSAGSLIVTGGVRVGL